MAWRAEPRTTPGGQALVLAPDDPGRADAAGRVPPRSAPDRRPGRFPPPPARPELRVPDRTTLRGRPREGTVRLPHGRLRVGRQPGTDWARFARGGRPTVPAAAGPGSV